MIKSTLEPHQIVGRDFLIPKKFGILGFKTGKGKSLTLIAALNHYLDGKNRFAVLFAPKNACEKVWVNEIPKHSDLKYITLEEVISLHKIYGSFAFLSSYQIIIVKYSLVIKYEKLITQLCIGRITAYDEAHRLKNPKAFMCMAVERCTTKAAAKWGLTATAVLNSIFDLYGMSEFFSPGIFGTLEDFKYQYCEMQQKVIGYDPIRKQSRKIWEITGHKNLDKLKAIREKFLLTANQDINVKFNKVGYSLTDLEEAIYLLAAQGILQQDKKGFAQRLPDLQRACDGSRDVNGNPVLEVRSSKYNSYLEKIREKLNDNESVIIFTEFYDTFDYLYFLLSIDLPGIPIFKISGKGVNIPNKYPCVVISTAGGSESLNLKFANHVFFYSIPFSIGAFIQTTGRITRMDSEYLDNLNVYVPYNESTIDFYKYTLLEKNTVLINTLLGEDANLPKEVEVVRQELIRELRETLLWRTREASKIQTFSRKT